MFETFVVLVYLLIAMSACRTQHAGKQPGRDSQSITAVMQTNIQQST